MTSNERLVPATYTFCVVVLGFTMVDWITATWPFEFGTVNWRFTAVGIIASSTVMPMMTLLILLWIGAQHERLLTIRISGILLLLMGSVLLIMVPLFLMDALQLKALVQSNRQRSFEWTVARAVVKLLGGFAICVVAGVASLRLAASMSRRHGKGSSTSGLVAR